jgi:hypothetical protein
VFNSKSLKSETHGERRRGRDGAEPVHGSGSRETRMREQRG